MTAALALAAVLALTGDPDAIKLTFAAENSPLSDVLSQLTSLTDVPIELDDAARKKLGDPDKLKVSVAVKDLTLTNTIKVLVGSFGVEVRVVDRKKIVIAAK